MRTIIECVPNVSEGARPSRHRRDGFGGALGGGRAAPRRLLGRISQPQRADLRGRRRGREGRGSGSLSRSDRSDRSAHASRRAPAHGRGGRRPVHPGAGKLGRRLRRAVPRRRRGDRRRVRRAGLPLRGVRVRGAPPQPRGGAQGPVRGVRREDEGSPLGTRTSARRLLIPRRERWRSAPARS